MRLLGLKNSFRTVAARLALAFALIGLAGSAADGSRPATPPDADFFQQTQWTAADGLPQNSITSLIQTRDGYLWIGTFGGLARFDGVKFTVFNTLNVPILTSQRIVALYEDPSGTLWIGTENGQILRYLNGHFQNFDVRPDSNITPIFCFFVDSRGDLWTNDSVNQVIRYSFDDQGYTKKEVLVFAPPPDPSRYPVQGFTEDSAGNVWIYSINQILYYRDGRFKQFNLETDFPYIRKLRFEPRSVFLWGITVDKNGTVWTATTNGTARFDGRTFVRDVPDGTLDGVGQSYFIPTPDGELLAVLNRKIARFDNGRWTELGTIKDGRLPFRKFLKDFEGNFWLGTYGQGLIRLKTPFIKYFGESLGVTRNKASSILEDGQGNLWASSYDLLKFENGRFTSILKSQGGAAYTALYEKRDGEILIGTWNTLIGYRNGKFTDRRAGFIPLIGEKSLAVNVIFEDGRGTMWYGLSEGSGADPANERRNTAFTEKDGLISATVQFIFEDRRGALWFGTYGGVSRYENDAFTNYTTAEGLTNDNVRAIYEDRDGALWFGTYGGGLNRLKDGKWAHISTENGLFDDVVSRIIVDDEDNFWMLGNRGIFVTARTELDEVADGRRKSVNCRSFGTGDGLEIAEGTGGSPAGWHARDGNFWFPMINGVIRITPPPPTLFAPPTYIEEAVLEGSPRDPNNPIEINPGEGNLEIRYTALGFTKPEQIRFKYRMKGLSDEWIETKTRRTAYFSYLPPGEYTFTVVATNGDGVWNTDGKSLTIRVLPPFYRKWWFILLATLTICSIIFWFYHSRVSKLELEKRNQEEFSRRLIELQEYERQRIAGELHDGLSQNLVIIRNRAMLTLTAPEDRDNAFEQMEEIAEAATHSLSEVREIAHNLRPFQIDRLGLTKAIEGLVRKISSSGLRIESSLDNIDGRLPVELEINLYRIVQECLNNIVKHSQASEAVVRIVAGASVIELTVEDNGRGFDIASKNVQNAEHKTGFGMTSITERARILGSLPIIITAPNSGTKISLKIEL